MSVPKQHTLAIRGLSQTVFEWPGEGAPLVFAHATGFHARCWDQIISLLPGRRCLAVDLRGHGRSAKPAPPYHWRDFAEDLAAIGQALGLDGAVGIGHSMGGYAATLAAALSPGLFARLLLLDPTILREEWYRGAPLDGEHFVARRRNRWSSSDEMIERFQDRPPFSSWHPRILRDYCEYGLLPAPDGDGYVLACPPEIESSIYNHSPETPIFAEIATLSIPVLVVRAAEPLTDLFTLSGSPTAPDLVRRFPNARELYLPSHSHFIPMEDPALVARLVQEESRP